MASAALYGGTYNLLHYTLPKLGIETTFIDDPDDLNLWAKAIQPNTKVLYGETIGNPRNDVLDIEGVADVAHSHGIPLMLDNTIASPWLIRPLEWGCDIVVHSATKFIGGHGTSIGGVIVDGATFDFSASGKFPGFTEPDPAITACSTGTPWDPARTSSRRGCNCCVTSVRPSHRSTRSCSCRAWKRSAFASSATTSTRCGWRNTFEQHDQVEAVQFAGLPSSPWFDRARKYSQGRGAGSVPAFLIKGGRAGRPAIRRGARAAQSRGQHR